MKLTMPNSSDASCGFDMELWSAVLTDAFEVESEKARRIVAAFMAIIFTLSLIENILTCYVIYSDKTMHTVTNYYLFNLAVSDVTLSFAILFEFGDYYFLTYSLQSEWKCKMQWFTVSCLWNNTVLTITALAIERYIAILHPLKIKVPNTGWTRVMKIIGLLWVVAIALSLPEMLVVTLIKSSQTTTCFVIPTPLARVLNGVLAILTFFIPLIIMVFVYSIIIYKVNTRQKNLGNRDITRKMNKLMGAMMASFLISWLPYFIERLMLAALDPTQLLRLAKWWTIMCRIVIINSWLSVILNPLIFSLVSTKFRKALKRLWNVKIKKMPSSTRSRVFMEINGRQS